MLLSKAKEFELIVAKNLKVLKMIMFLKTNFRLWDSKVYFDT